MRKLPYKTTFISFRVSDKERLAIEIIANREDRNLSDTLRMMIRESAALRGIQDIGLLKRYDKKVKHE